MKGLLTGQCRAVPEDLCRVAYFVRRCEPARNPRLMCRSLRALFNWQPPISRRKTSRSTFSSLLASLFFCMTPERERTTHVHFFCVCINASLLLAVPSINPRGKRIQWAAVNLAECQHRIALVALIPLERNKPESFHESFQSAVTFFLRLYTCCFYLCSFVGGLCVLFSVIK